jgi:hypothetical protein
MVGAIKKMGNSPVASPSIAVIISDTPLRRVAVINFEAIANVRGAAKERDTRKTRNEQTGSHACGEENLPQNLPQNLPRKHACSPTAQISSAELSP